MFIIQAASRAVGNGRPSVQVKVVGGVGAYAHKWILGPSQNPYPDLPDSADLIDISGPTCLPLDKAV